MDPKVQAPKGEDAAEVPESEATEAMVPDAVTMVIAEGYVMNIKEVASKLGYKSLYTRGLCRAGKLDARKIRNRWYIKPGSIDEYIKARQATKVAREEAKTAKVVKMALAVEAKKERQAEALKAAEAAEADKAAAPKAKARKKA